MIDEKRLEEIERSAANHLPKPTALELVAEVRRLRGALMEVPVCNNEYSYELFCNRPKGHTAGCSAFWGAYAL